MFKRQLKDLGFKQKIVDELLTTSLNNRDIVFMIDDTKPHSLVSYTAFEKCNNREAIYSLLYKYEIYNVIALNMMLEFYTFICKYNNGNLYRIDLSKGEYKSIKEAFRNALYLFINNPDKNLIKNYPA